MQHTEAPHKNNDGFTLIELSIVLVIIGFIVGGILVGNNLIKSAEARAEISQIEKYQAAVNTFRGKYGFLPGDIKDPDASNFGFQPRGQYQGEGDGNGILAGNCSNSAGAYNYFAQGCGELAVFWEDLSTAGLIDAGIAGYDTKGANYPYTQGATNINLTGTSPVISGFIPPAKVGFGNFVYVYSIFGSNYFAVSSVTHIGYSVQSSGNPGITVQQAYMIDSKIDDGLPQSGNVTACYVNYQISSFFALYAAGNLLQGANTGPFTGDSYGSDSCNPTTSATPYLSTNCYDNNGVIGVERYSVAQNANITNCALSFKFQ